MIGKHKGKLFIKFFLAFFFTSMIMFLAASAALAWAYGSRAGAVLSSAALLALPAAAAAAAVSYFWAAKLARPVVRQMDLIGSSLEEASKQLEAVSSRCSKAEAVKDQFLANMSHELRTPLNSIIGFTARVIKKGGGSLPPSQLENLMIVEEQAKHLLELINSLLEYSKIEAGSMEVTPEHFSIIEVIDEAYEDVRYLMEDKPLKFEKLLNSSSLMELYSDRGKVRQILANLLGNAFKYSERGTIRLTVEFDKSVYSMCIEDEGIGISPEDLENIFEYFHQLDGSHTRKAGGVGLGLSMTRNLTELLGGTVRVESTPGSGSRFTVMLPAFSCESAASRSGGNGSGKDIFKVGDKSI
jgi:signal transduction histidine kinase